MADSISILPDSGATVEVATDLLQSVNDTDVSEVETHVQRNRVVWGGDGHIWDTSKRQPLPVTRMHHQGERFALYGTGLAAGASGTDTLMDLSFAGGPPYSGTEFALMDGYLLAITSVMFAVRGHATPTAQETTFTLRWTGGPELTTGSAAWFKIRCSTPASPHATDRVTLALDETLQLAGIDGVTYRIGVSANSTYDTNAPTLDILLLGSVIQTTPNM